MPPSGVAFPAMCLWKIFPSLGVSCPADFPSEGRSLEDPAPKIKQVDLCSGICRSFSSILLGKGFKLRGVLQYGTGEEMHAIPDILTSAVLPQPTVPWLQFLWLLLQRWGKE